MIINEYFLNRNIALSIQSTYSQLVKLNKIVSRLGKNYSSNDPRIIEAVHLFNKEFSKIKSGQGVELIFSAKERNKIPYDEAENLSQCSEVITYLESIILSKIKELPFYFRGSHGITFIEGFLLGSLTIILFLAIKIN